MLLSFEMEGRRRFDSEILRCNPASGRVGLRRGFGWLLALTLLVYACSGARQVEIRSADGATVLAYDCARIVPRVETSEEIGALYDGWGRALGDLHAKGKAASIMELGAAANARDIRTLESTLVNVLCRDAETIRSTQQRQTSAPLGFDAEGRRIIGFDAKGNPIVEPTRRTRSPLGFDAEGRRITGYDADGKPIVERTKQTRSLRSLLSWEAGAGVVLSAILSWLFTHVYYKRAMRQQAVAASEQVGHLQTLVEQGRSRAEADEQLRYQKRVEECMAEYLLVGTPDRIIDTYDDLTSEEKADLKDLVLRRARGYPAKRNKYRND